MDNLFKVLAVLAVFIFMVGCTDTTTAANEARWSDKPAAVTCYTYGQVSFDGFSTGRLEYDDGGRLSFVDQANGRYTVIEGDCRVVYAR